MKEGCTEFSEYFTNTITLLLSKSDSAQHTLGAEKQYVCHVTSMWRALAFRADGPGSIPGPA